MSALSVGELASNAYSRCGHTIAQYNGVSAAFDKSQKDQRAMNSNRHAVFAASLQCTDEVKVVSRGTPQITGVGDLGDNFLDRSTNLPLPGKL